MNCFASNSFSLSLEHLFERQGGFVAAAGRPAFAEGADVAVTSVILDAVKRRFPEASIYLVGPRKNWELFAADPRILHLPVN